MTGRRDRVLANRDQLRANLWPLAKAGLQAAGFLIIAAAVAHSGDLIDNADPNGTGPGPHHEWTRLLFVLTLILIVTAFVIVGRAVAAWLERQRQGHTSRAV